MSESIRQKQERAKGYTEVEQEIRTAAPRVVPQSVVHADVREIQSLRGRLAAKQNQDAFDKEAAEKEFERTAPLREAEARFRATANEVARAERALVIQDLFKKPSEEITRRTKQFSVVEDVTAGKIMSELEVYQAISKSFAEFQKSLKKLGVVLTQTGIRKLYTICEKNITADTRIPETFMKIFDYCVELGGVFTEADASGLENLNPVAPEPVVELEPEVDIEAISLLSREGEKAAKRAVTKDFWKQATPLYAEWIESLNKYWGFIPNETQKKQAFNLLETMNLSPLDRRSYDTLRRAAITRGVFPDTLYTPEEILNQELEEFKRHNPMASSREERGWIVKRSRELGLGSHEDI